jgi:transcriptional regulator
VGKPPTEPEELRREIEQTRAELGETVEALAAKADVKARAQEAVEDVKHRVHEAADEAKVRARGAVDTVAYQVGKQREKVAELSPAVRTAIAAVAVGLLALLLIRKLRGRRSK